MFRETTKYAMIILLVIFIEILLVSSLVRQSWVMENIEEENQLIEYYFGKQTASHIRERANSIYTNLIVNSGMQDMSYNMLLPQTDRDSGLNLSAVTAPLFKAVNNSLGTFWATVYQLLTRVQVWIMWVPAALLLVIPSIVDGLMLRKIKVATHVTTSSIRMKYALLTIVFSLFILLLLLFSPFAVNPVLPLLLSLLSAIMVSVILANVQKDI